MSADVTYLDIACLSVSLGSESSCLCSPDLRWFLGVWEVSTQSRPVLL